MKRIAGRMSVRCTGTLIAIICILVVGLVLFVWSGIYNISTTDPHWKITSWLLEKVRDRSISAHSRGIVAPSLKDEKLIGNGFGHYHAMCRLCHGAPGHPPDEFAEGLYPSPPNLTSREIQEFTDAELYWIVKNGIKMTGMPGFGVTHDEKGLWGIVAFLRRLAILESDGYNNMLEKYGPEEEGHHRHGAVEREAEQTPTEDEHHH